MSKFLNIFAPALGGTATLLGAAYIAADQFVVDVPAPLRGQAIPAAEAQTTPEPVAEEAAQATDTAPAEVAPEVTESQPEASAEAAPVVLAKFGLGRPATDDEIAAWDVKVMPDGRGLPEGSGSVEDGEALFSENCAVCHGEFAEGSGNWPKLAGGDGTLADEDPLKTVGSYWPYLSTTFDYIHRSMPFGAAQTLSADDTYAITAYILYSNFMVDEDFVLTRENFLEVEMPNAEGFIVDDRAETEYPQWRAEPCMENCKDSVEITMRATVLDVTPEEEGAAEEVAQVTEAAAPAEEAQTEAPTVETVAAEEPAPQEAAPEEPAAEETMAAADPELIAAGEKVFKKCKACHQVGAGAENKTGPQLNGIMGRTAGTVEGFKYSKAMSEAGEGGLVWNTETLAGFLAKPKAYLKGTKMSFNGLRKEDDIAAVEAYLGSFAE